MSTFVKRFILLAVLFQPKTFAWAQADSTKIKNLNEVIINANRVNSTSAFAYSDVGQKEIQKVNLGQDLPYLISQLPSVVVSSDAGTGIGYTGIRIRGSDPTRVNVTLNGVPYNDSESQGVYWVDMPDFSSSLQSVQVQRGVGTSTNGAGAFGGSLNVSTLQYNQKAFSEVNVSGGSFNTLKTNYLMSSGLLKNHFIIDGRISRIVSDGFVDRASSNLKSFYVSGGYYGKNSFVRLNVFSGHEITYQSWYGIPEALAKNDKQGIADFGLRNGYSEEFIQNMAAHGRKFNFYNYANQVDNYSQSHIQLISSLKLKNNWRFNPTLFYSKGKGYYEEYKTDQALLAYGFNVPQPINEFSYLSDLVRRKWLNNDFFGTVWSLEKEIKTKVKLNFGGGWNKYLGGHYGNVIWSKDYSELVNNDKYYNNNSIKTDFNIYSKANFSFSSKIDGYVDLQVRAVAFSMLGLGDNRLTLDQSKKYQFFNPKVGLTYKINKTSLAYVSFGVGNKEPSRQDFVDNGVNVPKAENLLDTELGLRSIKENWNFEANAFLMNYNNQLVLTGKLNSVGDAIRTNVAKSYRAGIELQANGRINPKVRLNANLTLSKNKIRNFDEIVANYDSGTNEINHFKNSDISFSPNIIAGGVLTYLPFKSFEISLLPKYVSKQFLDNTSNNSRKLDAYFINNLRLSYDVPARHLKQLNFSFLVNNLFNVKYQSNGYSYNYIAGGSKTTENFVYPQAGLNFLAAVRIRF